MLPLNTRFTLGPTITEEQREFLDKNGFLVFSQVAKPEELSEMLADLETVQGNWLKEGRKFVNGIPLFVGKGAAGEPFLQRFTFTSMFAPAIRKFVLDQRFEPIRTLIGADARVGHDEKDGVVVNRYINVPGSAYPRLGWHTDGLRDLFYLRMPQQMLNVGLHFDRVTAEEGGLRLIPGSHTQGFADMCFRKFYFLSHAPDPQEIAVETLPGDLTVHDGRLWHRVAKSPKIGAASLRRSMYVPYLTGPYEPKTDQSPTPFYHHLGRFLRWIRGSMG